MDLTGLLALIGPEELRKQYQARITAQKTVLADLVAGLTMAQQSPYESFTLGDQTVPKAEFVTMLEEKLEKERAILRLAQEAHDRVEAEYLAATHKT